MEEYFVAYIDFLGIKNKISKSSKETFEDLTNLYKKIINNIIQNNNLVLQECKLYSDIKISIFQIISRFLLLIIALHLLLQCF